MRVTFPYSWYAAAPCMDLAQENEAHMRLNGSFIWESQLPDWAGTDFHQPSLCTNVTVNVSKSLQTCLWNWVIHFSVFWGNSFANQNRAVIEVFYSHNRLKHTHMHASPVSSGPESSPAGSPTPACSQQQVIQHNTITTSTTTVGGSSVHGQTNHRTDINPIH